MADKKKKENIAGIVCIWCYSPLTIKDLKTHPCTQPDFLDCQDAIFASSKARHPSGSQIKKPPTKTFAEKEIDWYNTSAPWSRDWIGWVEKRLEGRGVWGEEEDDYTDDEYE